MNIRDRLPPLVVLKYYAFMATAFGGFHLPITVLIMQARGMTYTQIGTLMAVSSVILITMEIPMGYVGDRIGRRNSILIGTALVVLGMVGIGLSHAYWEFFISKAVFSVGTTFRSGSGDAWLYDALKERDLEDSFAKFSGRAHTYFLAILGAGSFLGGSVAELDIAYPYLIDAIIVSFSFLVVLTAPQAERFKDDDEDEDEDQDPLTFRRAMAITRRNFAKPPLRSFVLLIAFFVAIAKGTNNLFIQPAALEVGFDLTHVGWLYAVFTVVSATMTYFTGEIREHIGIERFFAVVPVVVGVSFAAASLFPLGVIPAFIMMRGFRRLTHPLGHQYINDHLGSVNRATALSVFSMIVQVFVLALTVAGGWLGDLVGPIEGVAVFGVALLVVVATIWLVEPPTGSGEPTTGGVDAAAE
jgi:MFS family permease